MKRIILLLIIISLIFAAVSLLKKRQQTVSDMPTPNPIIIQVKVASAETANLQQTRPFLAQLNATQVAEISTKQSGRIQEIRVKENQKVSEGDLLVGIDDKEVNAGILTQQEKKKAQQKDVEYAKSLHKRNKSLFKSGGLAKEKFEASAVALAEKKATLESTRQTIIELEVQLTYLNIKAPFEGHIGTIHLHKGSIASLGHSILSINSIQQKLTFSYVPNIIGIKIGQDVLLKDKKIGQISKLYSDADNGLSVAEVKLTSPLARPNKSYITINVITFSASGCRIPLNALIRTKEGARVMTYKDKNFIPFPVTIIADNKHYALIDPCPSQAIALASAAKLSELPSYKNVLINRSKASEK